MPDPVITHVGRYDWVSTPSLVGVPIGTPSSDRMIVLAAGLRRGATPGRLFTSFTLDGNNVPILGQVGPSNSNVTAGLAAALVPSGATADIGITANGPYMEGSLDVYVVTGADLTSFDVQGQTVDGGDAMVDLGIPDNSAVIACMALTGPATNPATWLGLANEGSDAQNGTQFRFSSAYEAGLIAQIRNISAPNPAVREAMIAASWGKAGLPGVSLDAAQTLLVPIQVASFGHPRQLTAGQTLKVPFQSATITDFPARPSRSDVGPPVFNSIPTPDGSLQGVIVSTNAMKDITEQLIGVRGDGQKAAVLREDLESPQFADLFGAAQGSLMLIPVSKKLPPGWKETTVTAPATYRYVMKS